MRPARFFLALLFGAAVLITFLKLLFFAAMAAVVLGGMYLLFQGIRHTTARSKHWNQAPFAPDQQFPMSTMPQNTIQPFGIGTFPVTPQQAFPRHIEVL
jgi:hypothetical protein